MNMLLSYQDLRSDLDSRNMPVLDIALGVLLGTCLIFSIVELGLTAYVATFWGGSRQIPYWDPYQGFVYRSVRIDTPGIVDLLLFSACWSILASIAAIALPRFYTRNGAISATINTILGFTLGILFIVTSVFWLACFAYVETLLNGGTSSNDYLSAVVAVAVLLWLLFLGLFILNILALCGVLTSTWPGYQSLRKTGSSDTLTSKSVSATQETHDVDHSAHERPMGTPPTVQSAPSELSSRDAEAMQHQSVRRVTSISSPSAIDSVELNGDSISRRDHGVSPV